MKRVAPYLFLLLALVVAGFISRGSGHVPRQLLLISGSESTALNAIIVAMPSPQPMTATPVLMSRAVARTLDLPLKAWSDPALTLPGDRSPPTA